MNKCILGDTQLVSHEEQNRFGLNIGTQILVMPLRKKQISQEIVRELLDYGDMDAKMICQTKTDNKIVTSTRS